MDLISLSIGTVLLTGTGLIGRMFRFDHPMITNSFFGTNPFAVKKKVIDGWTDKVFLILAVVGLALQLIPILYGSTLPKSIHSDSFYLSALLGGLLAMPVIALSLKKFAHVVAKWSWLPQIINLQKECFMSSKVIIDNDGWREDQLFVREGLSDKEKYRKANFESVEARIGAIESLLELPKVQVGFKERINRLETYFS